MVLFEQYAETNEAATKNASSDVFSLVQEEFMEICYDFDENSYIIAPVLEYEILGPRIIAFSIWFSHIYSRLALL